MFSSPSSKSLIVPVIPVVSVRIDSPISKRKSFRYTMLAEAELGLSIKRPIAPLV